MSVKAEEKAHLEGHRWQISSLEFSPDGSLLASGSWDKDVLIWDLYTLETSLTLTGQHAVPVTSVAWFPPDGSLLVTGSADCTACLWSTDSGEMLLRLREHFGWVMGASFAGNGSALATASWDKTVRVWDPATGALLTTLNGHTKGVYSCHFHPVATSTVVCSASDDETVRVWDTRMQGNKPLRTMISGHDDAIYCCRWSPDGNWIATGSADQRVTIWDARQAKVVCQMRGHVDTVKSLTFHPGAFQNVTIPLLMSAGDTSCRLWDPRIEHPDLLYSFYPHSGKEVEAVAVSPDGTVLATGGRDNDVVLSFLSVPRTAAGGEVDEKDLIWEAYKRTVRLSTTATDEAIESTADELSATSSESEDLTSDDDAVEQQRQSALPQNVAQRMLRAPSKRLSASPLVSKVTRKSIIEGDVTAKPIIHGPSMLRQHKLRSSALPASGGSTPQLTTKSSEDPAMLRNRRKMLKTVDMSCFSYLGEDVQTQRNGEEDDDIEEDEMRKCFLEDEQNHLLVEQAPIGDLGQLPGPTHNLAVSLPPSRTASIQNFFAEPDPLPDRTLPREEQEALGVLDSAIFGGEEDDEDDEEEEEEDRVAFDTIYGESAVDDLDSSMSSGWLNQTESPQQALSPPTTLPRPSHTLQDKQLTTSPRPTSSRSSSHSSSRSGSLPRHASKLQAPLTPPFVVGEDDNEEDNEEEYSIIDDMASSSQTSMTRSTAMAAGRPPSNPLLNQSRTSHDRELPQVPTENHPLPPRNPLAMPPEARTQPLLPADYMEVESNTSTVGQDSYIAIDGQPHARSPSPPVDGDMYVDINTRQRDVVQDPTYMALDSDDMPLSEI